MCVRHNLIYLLFSYLVEIIIEIKKDRKHKGVERDEE